MKFLIILPLLLLVAGCATTQKPLKTVEKVDLPRFMGSWYVLACIPTIVETEAYNAKEEYQLDADGTIATTFTFNKGAFEGPARRYTPRGFVRDASTQATWGMRFVWPFKSEFLITYLNSDYTQTIIGRSKRDYVWIMARTPELPEAEYQRLVAEVASQGYDISRLRKVPQRWPRTP